MFVLIYANADSYSSTPQFRGVFSTEEAASAFVDTQSCYGKGVDFQLFPITVDSGESYRYDQKVW